MANTNPLTTLPLLPHPLTIEDLRPEVTLSGAFVFAHPPWHGSSPA